jgi:hypothetical protein
VRNQIPTNLRKWESRVSATRAADALLRRDARRRRRMATNDALGSIALPAVKTKREDGPFAALRNHPLYRAPRNGAGTA